MVASEDFRNAFAEQWAEDVTLRTNDILQAYPHEKPWTQYMLTGQDSLLSRMLVRLAPGAARPLAMTREFYTLDAVFYKTGETTYDPGGDALYPDCLRVLIEHENKGDVEREMYKLLMFRSPLKVLIFYDYRDDERDRNKAKATWLSKKLDTLQRMRTAVNRCCEEAVNTEYLFLIGNRAGPNEMPAWRYGVICIYGWGGLHPL